MPSDPVTAGGRIRFPLSWKILLWFALNVLFVAVVGLIFVQVQLRLGVEALLAGSADERLQALSSLLVRDLEGRPTADWSPILARYAAEHGVQIGIFLNDGTLRAGTIDPLPPQVRERLTRRDPGPERRGPPPPPREDEGFDRGFDFGGPPPVEFGEGPRGPDNPASPRDKFLIRAGAPPAYWIGLRVRLIGAGARPMRPSTIVVRAPSLGAGGLLFDYRPLIIAGGCVLICSVIFWIPLVRGITRSVRQMTGAASAIAHGQFDTQVDATRQDELGRLGLSLNHMAGRLREFVTGQKRFLGDIAHELCSPLARMEMALGVLDQRAADEKQRAYLEDVREEVRHMSGLVNELLSFSKAGVQGREVALRDVPLEALVRGVLAREAREHAEIVTDIDPALTVRAEPELLARAIGNVVRNSLRYASGGGGPITLRATPRGAEVVLTITDQGPGVPADALHRLFDPFFRPESARTREGGGTGLGLAIVKTCVEACGGTVTARNVAPTGLQVEMRLIHPSAAIG
jgi:two-component system sensor histidine kinase CpxA